jgi:hypothetical protein
LFKAIASSPSVWEGVVIIPSSKAYEPPKEPEADPANSSAMIEDQELTEAAAEDNQIKGENMPQIEQPIETN